MQTEDYKPVLKTVGMARKRRRAQGCGSCPGCLREDCGQCRNCKDKIKFGGPGTKKQKCMLRACTNMQRKIQKQETAVEEKDLNSAKITCVFCGRRRKKGLSRSSLFCTKHCQTRWQECHPGETPSPVPQVSDGQSDFFEAVYSLECDSPTPLHNGEFVDEGTTHIGCDNTQESQLLARRQSQGSRHVEGMNSPPNVASIPYPLMLSPAPTPISSPRIYTPTTPNSAGSQVNVEKWKEIARKLAFHSELRTIWNQLKIMGRFLTNEHFISHLLRYEAARQGVHYDILCEKEDTQPDEYELDDEVASVGGENCSQLSNNAMLTPSTPTEALQGPGDVDQGETGIPSSSPEDLKGAPEPDETTDTCVVAASSETEIEICRPPDSSTQQCVMTVLDSQMQHSPDESGLVMCVDEVIDSL